MKLVNLSGTLDNFGIIASSLCAIHCAIVPILVTTLPLWGLGFLVKDSVEITMIGIAFFLGLLSLGLSYIKTHKRTGPFLVLITGFLLIATGHIIENEALAPFVVPFGGLIVALSHYVNWKYTKEFKSHLHQHQ